MKIELIPIDVDGTPRDFDHALSAPAREVLLATGALYAAVGFKEPWIGYLVVASSQAVGTCGFKSPPLDGRVEIAYFTFPEYENRGLATQMAGQLIALAHERVTRELTDEECRTYLHVERCPVDQ